MKHHKNRIPQKTQKTDKSVSPDLTQKDAGIFKNETMLHYSILFISAVVLYGWTSSFGYAFDDNYITNALVNLDNTFDGLKKIFYSKYSTEDYRPIVVLSFWIERFLFKELSAGTSHLINVLLFGYLLTRIYSFIVTCKFYNHSRILSQLALLACLIFLVHPNHVSVVANIKSRDNILSMLFGLMGAIQFIKMYDKHQWWRIALIILFLTLGFLSKADCYVFALAPVLIFMLFRDVNYKKYIIALVLGIIFLAIIYDIRNQLLFEIIEDHSVKRIFMELSRTPLAENNTFLNRLSLSFITLLYYLKFLLIPFGYHFYFGYNQIPLLPLFHPVNFLSFGIYLSIGLLCLRWFKKDKIYIFCFIFFLISIGYAANLMMPVSGILMDRYNFIPSLGFCIAVAAIFINFIEKKGNTIFINKWVLLFLATCVVFTIYRTSAWKNMLTLVNRDLPHLKQSVHAHRIAGSTYIAEAKAAKNNPEISKEYYKKAELSADQAIAVYDKSATVWEIKGICKIDDKKYREALEIFKKCQQLDSNYLSAINYIGVSYSYLGKTDSALIYFNKVMNKENGYGYSAQNVIDILIEQKKYEQADSVLKMLSKRFPDDIQLKEKIINTSKKIRQKETIFF